ncbi:MAG: hypothetical protein GY833_16440 [Aestuariibacter sp.]|nr:hypothetical protein [Aestuariibacter sp.]
MKTYNELNSEQKERALNQAIESLVNAIAEGTIRFDDKINGDNLQHKINKAINKADKMQTPWFAGELIMETCADEITGMAQCDAEDALYSEPHEQVMWNIA